MMIETHMGMEMIISVCLFQRSKIVMLCLFQRSKIKLRYATKWQEYGYTRLVSILIKGWKVNVKDSLAKC